MLMYYKASGPDSNPAKVVNRKQSAIAHSLSLSPFHQLRMTEILLNGLKNDKSCFCLTIKETRLQSMTYRKKKDLHCICPRKFGD